MKYHCVYTYAGNMKTCIIMEDTCVHVITCVHMYMYMYMHMYM